MQVASSHRSLSLTHKYWTIWCSGRANVTLYSLIAFLGDFQALQLLITMRLLHHEQ